MSLFGWLRGQRGPRTLDAYVLKGNGLYWVETVGESFYQDALWEAVGHGPDDEDVRVEVTAVLVREPGNRYDPNAVAVYIAGGQKVGHLSRKDAIDYGPPLKQLARTGKAAACNALIVGGGLRDDGERKYLGIFLDLEGPDSVL